MATRPGPIGFRIAATDPEGAGWPTLSETWRLAGELGLFDAAWLSDHLSNASLARGGGAFEAFTTAAALSSRVPGCWIGIAVASNTFRHPAVVAKEATVLDNATAGRFVLGLGAGWHEGEHDQFGIPLPPMGERFDRFESAVRTIRTLLSDAARQAPGVTVEDRFYPLRDATNEPPPVRPDGPPIWLGVTGRRGIALAARYADGWPMPGNRPGDVPFFTEKRAEIVRALEAAGRDPAGFSFAAQLNCGATDGELREARQVCLAFLRAGADHLIIGVPARPGPEGLRRMAAEVARPVRDAIG